MNKKLLFSGALLTISLLVLNALPMTVGAQTTPTITSISPTSATAGSTAMTLIVNGTNFASGSVVYLGTTALTTNYVSATQLTASIPATSLVNTGTGSVTVRNTDGTTSGAQTFTISAQLPDTGTEPNNSNLAIMVGIFAAAGIFAAGLQLRKVFSQK